MCRFVPTHSMCSTTRTTVNLARPEVFLPRLCSHSFRSLLTQQRTTRAISSQPFPLSAVLASRTATPVLLASCSSPSNCSSNLFEFKAHRLRPVRFFWCSAFRFGLWHLASFVCAQRVTCYKRASSAKRKHTGGLEAKRQTYLNCRRARLAVELAAISAAIN